MCRRFVVLLIVLTVMSRCLRRGVRRVWDRWLVVLSLLLYVRLLSASVSVRCLRVFFIGMRLWRRV